MHYKEYNGTLPLIVIDGEGPSLRAKIGLIIKIRFKFIVSSEKEVLYWKTKTWFSVSSFESVTGRLQFPLTNLLHRSFINPRTLLYSLSEPVEEALESQIKAILIPVTHPEWDAPIVSVMKPYKTVCMCGDYKLTVNKASTVQYALPRMEVLFASLAGCKIFSKLDLRTAYLQLELGKNLKV